MGPQTLNLLPTRNQFSVSSEQASIKFSVDTINVVEWTKEKVGHGCGGGSSGGGSLWGASSSRVSSIRAPQGKEQNMGKKLDDLLGRNSKTHKLKTLAKLTMARITILKKQRQVRSSQARSDVVQLLNLGHQDRALLRVEHVIKEQNMLDVYIIIENYCHLLRDQVLLVQNIRECPDELNEAISSLIFAASRCGELPELQEIRGIFTSRYGKEFTVRATESSNNSRVNLKMIRKLSTRQASLESRQELLKQIALDNGIDLHLEDDEYAYAEEKQRIDRKEKHHQPNEDANSNDSELGIAARDFPHLITRDEKFSELTKAREKYEDVAEAAREAFESAAYAAAAARAAVELSRSESWDEDPGDYNGSNHKHETVLISDESSKPKLQIDGDATTEDVKTLDNGLRFEKIHPVDSLCSESGDDGMAQNSIRHHLKDLGRSYKKAGLERTLSSSSSDRDISNRHQAPELGEEIVFDESDDETGKNWNNISWLNHHHSGSNKSHLPVNKFQKTTTYNAVPRESISDKKGYKFHCQSPKWKLLNPQTDPITYSAEGRSRVGRTHYLNHEKHLNSKYSNTDRKPNSVTHSQVHRDY
ncbi:hypothetical protein U1Q18_043977 [Sarracenia purpurea var. burkii]